MVSCYLLRAKTAKPPPDKYRTETEQTPNKNRTKAEQHFFFSC